MFQFPTWLTKWLGLERSPSATVQDPAPAKASLPATDAPQGAPDSWNATTAVELIARLMELTSTVANEVEEHCDHIESINAELSEVKHGDTAAVAAVVCKLLVVNQETQRRLERAELKIQAQQRQLQDVSSAARLDGLTGLINRRSLDEVLSRCLADFKRKGRPATLLLLDVDHFKLFNDDHGHIAGDEALRAVADVLRTHSRETDIIARFGGEEFIVVFTGAALSAVSRRAERMRVSILERTIPIDGTGLHISASAGLAELREEDDEQAWLKRADAALYAAKADDRNCLYWHDGKQPLRVDLRQQEENRRDTQCLAEDRHRVSTELAAESFSDPTFVASLTRRIAEWRRGGAPFSVILARLDSMEKLVAQHGNEARLMALKALTQMAHASLRDMDQPTRWTADGLAILLPSARLCDVATVSRRLMEAVERYELRLPDGNLSLSLSMGGAEVLEGNDTQRLLERALRALDAAVHAGGGQICLHDGLQTIPAPPLHHWVGEAAVT